MHTRLALVLLSLLLLFSGCQSIGTGPVAVLSATPTVHPHPEHPPLDHTGIIGWPFDPTQGDWMIVNGYYGRDDHDPQSYARYAFDFRIRGNYGSTTGKTIYSPMTGTLHNIGDAEKQEGKCVTISWTGDPWTDVMICHVDNPRADGSIQRGDLIGTVDRSDPAASDHIHMTLYFHDPQTSDSCPSHSYDNCPEREPFPFRGRMAIAVCSYPPFSGKQANEWEGVSVPCDKTPAALAAPQQIAPADGIAQNSDPINLRWEAVPGAAYYVYNANWILPGQSCSQAADGATDDDLITTQTQASAHFQGAQPECWRVWALDDHFRVGQKSPWWQVNFSS